jgi:hypothetical protein
MPDFLPGGRQGSGIAFLEASKWLIMSLGQQKDFGISDLAISDLLVLMII